MSSNKGRMSLSLNPLSLSSNSTKPANNSYFNESDIHQDIKITFSLPNGDLFEETVKNGETVQEIKRRLYSASKIPSNSMFYFNGRHMIDPMSLNDFPDVVGRSALQIEVKVKDTTTPQIPTHINTDDGGGKPGSENGTGHSKEDFTSTSISQQDSSISPTHTDNSGNGRDEKGNTTPTATSSPATNTTTGTTTPISTPEPLRNNKIILPKIPTLNLGDASPSQSPSLPPKVPPLTLIAQADRAPPSHSSSLPKIPPLNLVEDAPPPAQHPPAPQKIPTLNLVESPTQSHAQPAALDPLPSLPNAFDDSEPLPPPIEKKNSSSGEGLKGEKGEGVTLGEPTTIEVHDHDNDVAEQDQEKQIETLGGNKRWRFCFLV